jgi:protein CpxP
MISVVGVLVIGILIGALGTRLYFIDEIRRPAPQQRFRPDDFVERLTDELDLTREQLKDIREIGRETRERADALHQEMLPRVRAHMADARAELEALLTDEQRTKFDQMHERKRRDIERFLLGSGGGPRGARRGAGPPQGRRPGPPQGGRPHDRPPRPTD